MYYALYTYAFMLSFGDVIRYVLKTRINTCSSSRIKTGTMCCMGFSEEAVCVILWHVFFFSENRIMSAVLCKYVVVISSPKIKKYVAIIVVYLCMCILMEIYRCYVGLVTIWKRGCCRASRFKLNLSANKISS